MIIGMAPMALGLGEGGEQNAPLGRAVIGGLIFATIATLMFVPVVFSMVHKKQGANSRRLIGDAACPLNQRPPVSRRKLGIFGVVAVIGAGLIVVTGIRAREESGVEAEGMDRRPGHSDGRRRIRPTPRRSTPPSICPGRLEAYSRAPIFARVSGYLKSWSADIGARVKAGQVIAEIEAPDLDQQLLQARADLASQQASAKLSEATLNAAQVADRFELRVDAGNRRAHRRPLQQEGRGQFRPGQCRAAGGARRLQEDHRAVRRRRHRARHRRRRADQCRRRLRALRCSWFPTSASCASMSTCRRTTCPRSRSAPRPRSRCRNIRTAPLPRRSRPPRNRSMSPRARRGCSWRSTIRTAS